jgi:hypothetical protein
MSGLEEPTMESIQQLSENVKSSFNDKSDETRFTKLTNFIRQSRALYQSMLKAIPKIKNDSDKTRQCMDLLKLAEIIYRTENVHPAHCSIDSYYNDSYYNIMLNSQSNFYCGQNVKRILDSIERCRDNGVTIESYNSIQSIAIQSAITRQYKCKESTTPESKIEGKCTMDDDENTQLPECLEKLKKLREESEPYFKKQCKELIEFKQVPGSDPPEYTILLHSGFQKKVLGRRPGPSPNSTDQDGVFICKLRKAILAFLNFYKITFKLTDRFEKFDQDCDTAIKDATPLQASSQSSTDGSATNLQTSSQDSTDGSATNLQTSSQSSTTLGQPLSSETIRKGYEAYLGKATNQTTGGRLSRRRKAYKTTRRNNKYKNKKHYIKKRHTKKYKKSHRKSRR